MGRPEMKISTRNEVISTRNENCTNFDQKSEDIDLDQKCQICTNFESTSTCFLFDLESTSGHFTEVLRFALTGFARV